MDESRQLAAFFAGLDYGSLSAEVVERTKDLILDQLGVELAASTKPWSVAVLRYIRDQGSRGPSTIVNYGDKMTMENAAFANATFGHGFELDDTYPPGSTHPGSVVIPAALAVGERELIDGKKFLLAVVSGYEAMGRVARCVAPFLLRRGFHPTSTAGTFGAAAATAKVLGFDGGLMLNALSIAGSHSAGIEEYTQTGGSMKRTHAGIAAQGGMRSAFLARAGLTGPPTVLEGKKGFCQAFSSQYDLQKLVSGLGADFVVAGMGIKRHCCCYQVQAPLDATSKIVKEHGIKPGDIAEIVMGTNSNALETVGKIREPREVAGAQFSAAFSLAMCVVKGSNGFRDYTEENLQDADIKELARKVRLEVDDEINAAYPLKRAIRMTVKLKDGTTYQEKLEGARGTPANPMTRAELEEKFHGLATVVLADSRAKEIVKVVRSLDEVGNISTLSKLLVS
ncbi:MAG: MmgE/PrpD family protein [Chloroflexi bacterium]|nr:MmgE/PrpD family protein [Chloroflexota bacterium]